MSVPASSATCPAARMAEGRTSRPPGPAPTPATACSAGRRATRWPCRRRWQARLAGDGQLSRDVLVAGEQYGIGGQDSVRGFGEREISNDRGLRLGAELHGPDFGARLGPGVAAHALLFADHGRVRRNRPLPGETTGRASPASAPVCASPSRRTGSCAWTWPASRAASASGRAATTTCISASPSPY